MREGKVCWWERRDDAVVTSGSVGADATRTESSSENHLDADATHDGVRTEAILKHRYSFYLV